MCEIETQELGEPVTVTQSSSLLPLFLLPFADAVCCSVGGDISGSGFSHRGNEAERLPMASAPGLDTFLQRISL